MSNGHGEPMNEEPGVSGEDVVPSAEAEEDEPTEQQSEPSWMDQFNWWILVIPALALITFIVVLLFGANVWDPTAIHPDATLLHIVIVGAVILVALLIVEGVLLSGGHPEHLEDDEEPAPGPERPAAREEGEPPEGEGDVEILPTDDEVEGRQVLEMARPPKERVRTGVYSTTYVEIDREQVLRLEELVAERAA